LDIEFVESEDNAKAPGTEAVTVGVDTRQDCKDVRIDGTWPY
jgi:hypothetical protein